MTDRPADSALPGPVVVIDWLGGHCPVQAEGTVDGRRFYFRARGEQWSMGIGGADPVGEPEWEHRAWFGEWPEAGWMSPEQAEGFLREAAARFARGEPGGRLEDDAARWENRGARLGKIFSVLPALDAAGGARGGESGG